MTKLYAKDKERIAEVEKYEAGKRFLRRKCKKKGTRKLYVRGVLEFARFLSKNLDEIVDEYKQDAEENLYRAYDKWEMIYEDFGDHLKQQHPKGTTAKSLFQGSVGLINANVPKSAEIHPEQPEAHPRTIKPITIEDLRTVRNVADERKRAFIDVLKDTGMSRSDAVTLTYGQVKKAIETPSVQYHKIDVYRGKENVEYETWLGPNAIKSLRLFFKVRRQSGEEITDNSPIFAVKGGKDPLAPQSLSATIRILGEKAGITTSPHRIRKFFETYITAGGAHPLTAKYWMGHTIHVDVDSSYIIPTETLQREQYKEAYKKIDLEAKALDEKERRIQAIRDNLRMLGKSEEEIRMVTMRLRRASNIEEAIKEVLRDSSEPEDPNCANGEHCSERFEEIDESALLQYLRQGWRVAHKLENGRVIVKTLRSD